MIGIYKIQNKVTDKVYIGKSVNIEKRWIQHRCHLNNNVHANDYLQKAWNKYGENGFNFSVLCECEESVLDEKEIYYINLYKATDRSYGYNLREGGDGGAMSQETIEKLRGVGSTLSEDDVRHIKMCMYLLMDRKEIAEMYNVSPKVLTAISQGKNWGYVLPELNDKIHNLKQSLIDERNQMIIDYYDNELKITDIVKLTGLSTSIVEKAVYKYRDIKSKDSQMEKYNKMFELHNQGVNNYQISKIVGVSASTVQRYLSGEQHPLNKPSNKKITDEIEDKVIDMYFNDNLGSVEIGEILDLSKTTVMNIVNNFKNKSTALSGVSA